MNNQQATDALANLRELREREADVLFVNCHTGECLDDVWVVLDYVAALEAVADAAAAIKADASWFADDGKLRIDDTEFNALRDALKAVGQ